MDPAVTALYRSHAVAHLVRDELERAGVERHRITVLPSARIVPHAAEASGSGTTRDNIEDALHRLDELHLTESDTHICRHALLEGGCVVSVCLREDADLGWVSEVMERPGEAYGPGGPEAMPVSAAAGPAISRATMAPASGL